MLNKAHVIEIKKACKVAFMQARESVVVRYREELVNWKKRQDGGNLFFKASSLLILINIKKLFMVQQSRLWTTYQIDFMKS